MLVKFTTGEQSWEADLERVPCIGETVILSDWSWTRGTQYQVRNVTTAMMLKFGSQTETAEESSVYIVSLSDGKVVSGKHPSCPHDNYYADIYPQAVVAASISRAD